MRHVWCCAAISAVFAVTVHSRTPASPGAGEHVLAVILDFRGSYAPGSVQEMKREVATILHNSVRTIEWRSWAEASATASEQLTVLRFNGSCGVPPWPRVLTAGGPLGFTHISDGVVLPFGEVACDRIGGSVVPVIANMDLAHAELLFGRAMARVVAHELVHMISRSRSHGHDGVAQATLSERQLIEDRLRLSPNDLGRVTGQERR
jgi:hypothetical protein